MNQIPIHQNPTASFRGFVYHDAPDPGFFRGKGSKEPSAVRYHLYQRTMRSFLSYSLPFENPFDARRGFRENKWPWQFETADYDFSV
jgi:hypothetical protein